jgi:hypothetical protein
MSDTYKVLLSNRGNPDHQQDPGRPLYGTPKDQWAEAPSIEACAKLCRAYITLHELGGGNWTGGVIVMQGGQVTQGTAVLGIIAYGGRFFPIDEPHAYGQPTPRHLRAIAKLVMVGGKIE